LQQKGLPLLTNGEDVVILSLAGSGKATLMAISALYRLYVKKRSCSCYCDLWR